MNASEIRKTIRNKRRVLTSAQQQSAAENLAALISQQASFLRAKRIGLYLANDGEIDPSILMGIALNANKTCFLPIIHPLQFNRLYFGEYRNGDSLETNRFGIPEPKFNSTAIAPLWTLDLILLPLVAFDRSGNRIGMGGGFYDRTLAAVASQPRRPTLIGLAHHCQEVESISQQSWDIPLDQIVTDLEIIRA
ncbi:MAG: 5-formyltetrahydrofolate cyclo-ligase [Porticoccaceae bacterium]